MRCQNKGKRNGYANSVERMRRTSPILNEEVQYGHDQVASMFATFIIRKRDCLLDTEECGLKASLRNRQVRHLATRIKHGDVAL